jgi:N6-adenosine-specific RNA methylase IME4
MVNAAAGMRYRTIVCDPPWRYPHGMPGFSRDLSNGSTVPYATMSVAEIAALPVAALAGPDAHLYLWVTNTHLPHAWEVVRAWGFTYSTLLTWCKVPRGAPFFPAYAVCTEHVLFCRRGTLPAKTRQDRNWWEWRRRQHSAKPEHFIDMVEQVSPGPYLELFSRRHRLGWSVWGDEVGSSIDLAQAGAE